MRPNSACVSGATTRGGANADSPICRSTSGCCPRWNIGLPACAGVAMGIERLLMAMLATDDIRDVLAFGFSEA